MDGSVTGMDFGPRSPVIDSRPSWVSPALPSLGWPRGIGSGSPGAESQDFVSRRAATDILGSQKKNKKNWGYYKSTPPELLAFKQFKVGCARILDPSQVAFSAGKSFYFIKCSLIIIFLIFFSLVSMIASVININFSSSSIG